MKKILLLSITLFTLLTSSTAFSGRNKGNGKGKYHIPPSKKERKFQRTSVNINQQKNSRNAHWLQMQQRKKEQENIFPLWLRNIEI